MEAPGETADEFAASSDQAASFRLETPPPAALIGSVLVLLLR